MLEQHFLNYWLERHKAFFKDLEPTCREVQLWAAFVDVRAQVEALLKAVAEKKDMPKTPPESAPAAAAKYPQLDVFGEPVGERIEKGGMK